MSEPTISGGALVPYRAQLPAVRDNSGATATAPQQGETVVRTGAPEPPPITARDVRHAAGFSGADNNFAGEPRVGHDNGSRQTFTGAPNGGRAQVGQDNGRPQNLADVVGRTREGLEDARAAEIARRQNGGGALPGIGSELKTAKALLRNIFGGGSPEPAPAATHHTEEWRMPGTNGQTIATAANEGMARARTGMAEAASRFSRWIGTPAQLAAHAGQPQVGQGDVPEDWHYSTGVVDHQHQDPAPKRYC